MKDIIEKLVNYKNIMRFETGASEDLISNFEREKDIKFPEDYKEWLLFSNGGEIFVPGTEFYSIDELKTNIHTRIDSSRPKSLLAIGKLNFGDPIFLDPSNSNIVQWDHETDEEFLRWDNFASFLKEQIEEYNEYEKDTNK